jgi:hypothetical protein
MDKFLFAKLNIVPVLICFDVAKMVSPGEVNVSGIKNFVSKIIPGSI